MINPFDNEHEACLVLVNDDDQHSLWPASVTVPDGWSVVHSDDSRAGCLAYVEALWTERRVFAGGHRRVDVDPRDGDLDAILRRADAALYRGRSTGRDTVAR
jgi:uncharacterized protein YbdZ (MbtH family)